MRALAGPADAERRPGRAHRQRRAEANALARVPRRLLVGGSWREASAARRLEVEDPATGHAVACVADASSDDFMAALAASDALSWLLRPGPSPEAVAEALARVGVGLARRG